MGKGGKSSSGVGFPQKHLQSRISYIYQAAVYLNAAEGEIQKIVFESPESKEEAASKSIQPASPSTPRKAAELVEIQAQTTHADASNAKVSDTQLSPQMHSIAIQNFSPQTHHLLSSMRSVSQKSQIRLSRSIKRSVCRRCNALLTMSSTAKIENASRGGRKPWADVLVVTCCQCGFVRRYPVGMSEEGKHRRRKKLDEATTRRDAESGHTAPLRR